jgi:mannose-1-phosphate guanylyltransferase/mannose-6-phosphate isomerase
MKLIPAILAGGGGTRLWPLSRTHYPKQFLTLSGRNSLLQQTLTRLGPQSAYVGGVGETVVVCNEQHRFLVIEQARRINIELAEVVLEPVGRNTAPALTCAAIAATRTAADALLCMMPADHIIRRQDVFSAAVAAGIPHAVDGKIVTFGIVPDKPETGLGYIKIGAAIDAGDGDAVNVYRLGGFVEKPVLRTARRYLKSGRYLWNSGIFMVRASVWLGAVAAFRPDILEAVQLAMRKGRRDGSFFRVEAEGFKACPSDSIDYAVMEHLGDRSQYQGVVVGLDAGWSDVGSWASLWEVSDKDAAGNVHRGDVCILDGRENLVYAQNRLVTTLGCDGMAVIETADAVLVMPKDRAQDVKQVTDWLTQADRVERMAHRRVYRPWGSCELLDAGVRFRVNRLTVRPGGALSLQAHQHRVEHWTVVQGTAKVTRGDEEILLGENQSTFVPVGMVHSIANPGKGPLEIIEIQSGTYFSDDDVVRYEDI